MTSLRDVLEYMKRECPLTRTVKLRVVPMGGPGTCSLSSSERFITICINAKDPLYVQKDSLIHEYAHAMEFDLTGNHSKLWGECHSKAYTAWTKMPG